MENLAIVNDYISSIAYSGRVLGNEIHPLCMDIEEMMARLEEFENLLTTIKSSSNEVIKTNLPRILAFQPAFNDLCKRIDKMEIFLNVVENNVEELEEVVEVAQNELNVRDYSLKSLLVPLFRNKQIQPKSNLNEFGEFVSPKIFKTSDFIKSKSMET